MESLTSAQHSKSCAIMVAYEKWKNEMNTLDNSMLDENKFQTLGGLL